MSHILYLASASPLEARPNPHMRSLSVNKAFAEGLDIPDFMLEPDFDREGGNRRRAFEKSANPAFLAFGGNICPRSATI